MAGYDFSVVTPRSPVRPPTMEEAEAENRRQLALGRTESFDGPDPTGDTSLDIAPETLPVNTVQVPLPGAIKPNVQAVLDKQGEPAIPDFAEAADIDLPPVVPAERRVETSRPTVGFASDEEALAFLSAGAQERTSEPLVPTSGFGSDEEALAFLQGAEQRAPEIKLPAPRPTPKPVTTPEAGDGSDVTFDAKGPAFQFTGTLVMDPETGTMATDPLKRAPRLVPSEGGQIVFDQSSPERFTQGVEEAFAAGILPQSNYEKIKADEAKIFKVMDDRRKLEARAQADPKLLIN